MEVGDKEPHKEPDMESNGTGRLALFLTGMFIAFLLIEMLFELVFAGM